MLQSAAIRYSRAEVEAITDGLTGLYNHRYLHERLEEELKPARRARDAARACCSSTATSSRSTTTPTATRPETPPWRVSPASPRPAAAGSTWRRATAARSSCWCWSTPTPRGAHGRRAHPRRGRVFERAQRTSAERERRRRHLARRRRRQAMSSSTRPTGRCMRPSVPAATRCSPSPTGSSVSTPGSRGAAGSRNACQAGPKPAGGSGGSGGDTPDRRPREGRAHEGLTAGGRAAAPPARRTLRPTPPWPCSRRSQSPGPR